MNRINSLTLLHKIFRKLKLKKFGGYFIHNLNKVLNKPPKSILAESDYTRFLNAIHKDVRSSSLCNNAILTPTCDLQIIIPVYNTGEFLRECINSVLNQKTKYKYHLVIVNDGSTDNSGEILSEYNLDERITIINQSNQGFSGARNTGLRKIFGKYLTFLDSDDMLAPNAITNWLDAAYKYGADVVEGSYQRRTPAGKLFGGLKLPGEAISNKSRMQGFAWLKIYKADIWENICFPEHYWYEDTVICGLILPKVNVYVQIPDYVYYYTVNKSSISFNSRGKKKSLDNVYITDSVLRDAEILGYIRENYEHYYRFFLSQIHTNWDRNYLLGPEIEYAVFKFSCNLFDKYFHEDIYCDGIPDSMIKALRKSDFNLYRYSNFTEFE